jgi:hypothetical protein
VQERNFQYSKNYQSVTTFLFDNNKEALTNIHESLMAQNRHGDIEKMVVAKR